MSAEDKKTVLITGASRGIGAAILQKFLPNHTVIGTATTQSGADKITATIKEASGNGSGMVLDLTKPESITDVLANIAADFSAPSILINNAGITDDTLFLRMNEEQFDRVLQANLYGIFRLAKSCVKPMIKARWGRIVNISSVVAFTGNAGQVNYSCAKAGVLGFAKSLARELANRNITVNTVAPGFIDTDMTQKIPSTNKEKLLESIPMGRMGLAKEVAAAVAFLASLDASYVTGETIHVNGGMLMN